MNTATLFGHEIALVATAIEALHASTGIHGELLDDALSKVDTRVSFTVHGQRLEYDCRVKKKVDRYALPFDLVKQLDQTRPVLLVSSPLSQDMANRCRELGLQFIDTAGNAYLNDGAGIYIFVSGRRGEEQSRASLNSTMTPAVLRMMFAFLAEPALLNAPYRDIAYRVRVSTGVIGKSFDTLETRGLIGTTGGKRMIRTPELFLNEWASGYAGRLKPKLKQYRFARDKFDKFLGWTPEFRLSAWSGEPAARILTRHLQPEAGTIYVDMRDPQALREIVKEFHLRADPQGPIEIVEMFWDADAFTQWFPTVPPHLVYADLMATHDSRNIAVARQIALGVIDHVHHTTG